MVYEVTISEKLEKLLKKLPKEDQRKLIAKIDSLQQNPKPSGCKKIKGTKDNLFRIRSGDYRIIYSIFADKLLILILEIEHRKEVYRNF